jgi:hypothetical protein
MATNISKYIQISDHILCEYEFNRDGVKTAFTSGAGGTPTIAMTELGTKQFFAKSSQGGANNELILNSVPTNAAGSSWYVDGDSDALYFNYFDSSTAYATPTTYEHDTIKLHVIAGYNFDDISGFLLQIKAMDNSTNLVDMSNFTWINQITGTDVLKFASNSLYLGNRFYDKYLQFKIPSIQELGGDTTAGFPAALNIELLSDVYITYSTITSINNDTYIINEEIDVQLPVTSVADNFNCLIAESGAGDFIEFYATWEDTIIGNSMNDIETGRIRLYTSNNPNDNFEEFSTQYGVNTARWVLMHEIYVYEHIAGGSSLLTQKYVFTQEDEFSNPNWFRPVIKNADIISSYSIDYICRLTNRMDGTQITRKASFSSLDPQKYGKNFLKLNIDNVIPYKVFNRLEEEKRNDNLINPNPLDIQFVKVFYDKTNILLDAENTVFPQGTGPMFVKRTAATYTFKFTRVNVNKENPRSENVDLSGSFDYNLVFTLDDDSLIEVAPTYSTNMNTVLGQLEFKLTDHQSTALLRQTNNAYSIVVKNPDKSSYVYYEGLFYSLKNYTQVIAQYSELYNVTDLQNTISDLEVQISELQAENTALKAT